MKEPNFTKHELKARDFAIETKNIATFGLNYAYKNKVIRNILISNIFLSIFFVYGFYSWQKYFLDLLGHNLIWVSGVIAALVGLSQIFGSLLVKSIINRFRARANVLIFLIFVQTITIVSAALTTNFYFAVTLYLLSTIAVGIFTPIKMSWINSQIPSKQRATLLSLDALFQDGGGTVGQVGLGYLSKAFSIPLAWFIGGSIQIFSAPFLLLAKKQDK